MTKKGSSRARPPIQNLAGVDVGAALLAAHLLGDKINELEAEIAHVSAGVGTFDDRGGYLEDLQEQLARWQAGLITVEEE